MTNAMPTATIMSDRVIIIGSQTSSTPASARQAVPDTADRTPPIRQPMAPVSASTPGHRRFRSTHSAASTSASMPEPIGLKIRVNNQWSVLFTTVHL